MTLIHIHIPGDAPMIEEIIAELDRDPYVAEIYRDGDSYRTWGERRRDDDPEHVVVEVPFDAASWIHNDLGCRGIPVDATLADDWTARVLWSLDDSFPGWETRYHRN